jgi:hypothetical protein
MGEARIDQREFSREQQARECAWNERAVALQERDAAHACPDHHEHTGDSGPDRPLHHKRYARCGELDGDLLESPER